MDNKLFLEKLQRLGLSKSEAQIYLQLLRGGASTHLELNRETGISRTKVYRLVEQLEERGLVSRYTDDTGRYITAADPGNLSIQLSVDQEHLENRRELTESLIPQLSRIRKTTSTKEFSVREYKGKDGFRQMLWQELKAKGELLVFGGATVEELSPTPRWAERYRAATMSAGYHIRELLNERRWDIPFSGLDDFTYIYSQRYIDKAVINLSSQISIFNDTVNVFHWRNEERIGVVVINQDYAAMMRQVFETYWLLGTDEPQDYTLPPGGQVSAQPHENKPAHAKVQSG